MTYVMGEIRRFHGVVDDLLQGAGLSEHEISALFLPSTGENRNGMLFEDREDLLTKLQTDFRYAHMGGTDVLLFLHQYLQKHTPSNGDAYLMLSPAYTAQWGGVMLQYREGL